MKTQLHRLMLVLSCAFLALSSMPAAFAEDTWYAGEAECLGTDDRPRVILTTVDGKKLALELRGAAESLMSKVLPEGKIAKVRVKGELKNRTLIVTAYEMTPEDAPIR